MEYRLGYHRCLVARARSGILLAVVRGRFLALLLTTVMVFSLLSTPASAAPVEGTGYWTDSFSDSTGISSSTNVTVSGGDIVMTDTSEILRPVGAGSSTSEGTIAYQTPDDANHHWEKVDEASADDATTMIYQAFSSEDQIWRGDLYTTEDHSVGSGTISSVIIHFRVRRSVSSIMDAWARPVIQTYDTQYNGTTVEITPFNTWTDYSQTWTTNPNSGNPWTWEEIDSLQIGVGLRMDYALLCLCASRSECTQVYVEIEYTATGEVISDDIEPSGLQNWDTFSWDDTEPANTDLTYQLEYYDGDSWELIPDVDLSGNSAGFDTSPVNLIGLDIDTYTQLRLKANFSTSDKSATPTLHDWYISWNGWKDGIVRFEKVGASSGVTNSSGDVTLTTYGTQTPFSDSFETDLTKWDGNGSTDWFLSTDQEKDGSKSVKANSGDEGALKSDDIDLSSALTANLNFWFRKVATDAGDDFLLYFWNGSSYDLIDDLDNNGGDSTWISWDNSINLGTYGVSDFHIYFLADVEWPFLGTEERCWVDQLALTVTEAQSGSLTSTAITPSSTCEWDTFTASHDLPSNTDIDYKVLDASDDSTLCTITAAQAAAGYDVSSCVGEISSVKVFADMSTTDGVDTPTLEDWTVTWTLPNAAPTASAPVLWDTEETPSQVSAMTPQVEYNLKVYVTDTDTLDDLSTVEATLFYDSDGSYSAEDVPSSGNTQTAAVFTWTNGGSPAWTINPGSNTSWTIESDNCVAPLLTGTSGNFEFHFKPGKVATETTGSAKWHIYAEADDGTATGDNYSTNKDMNWYGEVTSITSATSFGTVALGSEATISGTVSATYISNGAYDEQVKSEASWIGQTSAATLSLYIAGTDPGTTQFAMLADDDGTQDGAVQVLSASYASIDDIGTQTGESGDTASNNHLWLWLGSIGIPDEEYQGAVYYKISDGS